ncbi:MAG: hypothetical protein ABR520_11175 [Mycobacteriales bacterium]|nr:hypothetical protein [Actinomycetota bacterium]
MAPKQEGLPGIPQPPKRKVIDEIEDLCLDIDKDAGKRTAISDKIAEKNATRQGLLVKHKLDVYTYEDTNGVLQDVQLEKVIKKRKSKLNPKKPKKGDDE